MCALQRGSSRQTHLLLHHRLVVLRLVLYLGLLGREAFVVGAVVHLVVVIDTAIMVVFLVVVFTMRFCRRRRHAA